jgi:drug/metabolite transporter (DMT)-like permease
LAVVGALAVVYVVWGSTYLGIAIAIETMPPLLMAGARFLLAGAVLYAVAARLPGAGTRPTRRDWAAAAASGGFLFVVGNGGVAVGEETVPSGIAALVIASIPLWIALFDRVVTGRRLSLRTVVGIAVGFAGVALLVDPTADGRIDPFGGTVLVVAAVGWAIGTLLSRGSSRASSPLVVAAMQMIGGGVLLLAAGTATGELGELDLGAVSTRSWLAVAYLVVFGSLLAFSCYVWLLRNASTSLVATYAYANPIVAVALGWAFLDEPIGARTLVAGGIVLAAVALIVSSRSAPAPAPRRSTLPARLRSAGRSHAAAAIRGR